MGKQSFKMKDRMKLVFDRPAANSCTFTVSGKTDTVFSFSKKRAGEIVNYVRGVMTAEDTVDRIIFRKSTKSPAGYFSVVAIDSGTYCMIVNTLEKIIFFEDDISRKNLKKIVKTMREVWGIE